MEGKDGDEKNEGPERKKKTQSLTQMISPRKSHMRDWNRVHGVDPATINALNNYATS